MLYALHENESGWGVFHDYKDIIKIYGDKPDVVMIRREVEKE